jgi:hypothetical protein
VTVNAGTAAVPLLAIGPGQAHVFAYDSQAGTLADTVIDVSRSGRVVAELALPDGRPPSQTTVLLASLVATNGGTVGLAAPALQAAP